MVEQNLREKIINLRRKAAEYYQKAAWIQLLALDSYRDQKLEAAERYAQLSFEDQMNAMEFAELADAESEYLLETSFEEES